MSYLTNLKGKYLFFIGIKGTIMAPLAVRLSKIGIKVSGCDSNEHFATEEILKEADINWSEGFSTNLIPPDSDLIVYSAAYRDSPLVKWAIEEGFTVYSHPDFIAKISETIPSYAISGTHGKSTAAGALEHLLPDALYIYGSRLQGESPLTVPPEPQLCFIEACEYREHFLRYTLQGALVTTVDWDHPDFYPTQEASLTSFKKLVERLPQDSPLVCGGDSSASHALIAWVKKERSDLQLITYGVGKGNDYRLELESSSYRLEPLKGSFKAPFKSAHFTGNLIGGALLAQAITGESLSNLLERGATFMGCRGRFERLLDEGGVTYIDDYAHHPNEIRASIEALRATYPHRRLVIIFHPHTASRTRTFFDQFVAELKRGDLLLLRPIAASARGDNQEREVLSLELAQALGAPLYSTEKELVSKAGELLHSGDLCVTMGAGNNYQLGATIAHYRRRLDG